MTDQVPPNLRALRILEVLSEQNEAPTPTELNAQLGWPKQTVHRLCQTLIEAGILEKHDRRLYPGQRTNLLATGLANRAAARVGCHQLLRQLAAESGETVNFVRPEPRGMNYVDRVETNWAFRVALPIGTHVPFHCTASGKIYMASLPAARRRALLHSLELTALTSNTFTDVASLAEELSAIRRLGYSLDREEFHDAMVAIAVPVTDSKGRFYAALAIHGPTQRFSLEDALARRESLASYARRVGDLLFPKESDLG
ncbi:MAG: IclR family transcriptional regulator [Candidatus Puniceispirillaceae bacterium]